MNTASTVSWASLVTRLTAGQSQTTEAELLAAYRRAFGVFPTEEVAKDAGLTIAAVCMLRSLGLDEESANRAVSELSTVFELVIEAPKDLNVISILDSRYLTWKNARGLFDLTTGVMTLEPVTPLVSVAIVLNELARRMDLVSR